MEDCGVFKCIYNSDQFNPYGTKITPLPYIWPGATTPGAGTHGCAIGEVGYIAASLPPHPYGLVRVQQGREPMAVPLGGFAFHSSPIPAPPYGVVRLHLGREPMAVPLGGFAVHSSPIPPLPYNSLTTCRDDERPPGFYTRVNKVQTVCFVR